MNEKCFSFSLRVLGAPKSGEVELNVLSPFEHQRKMDFLPAKTSSGISIFQTKIYHDCENIEFPLNLAYKYNSNEIPFLDEEKTIILQNKNSNEFIINDDKYSNNNRKILTILFSHYWEVPETENVYVEAFSFNQKFNINLTETKKNIYTGSVDFTICDFLTINFRFYTMKESNKDESIHSIDEEKRMRVVKFRSTVGPRTVLLHTTDTNIETTFPILQPIYDLDKLANSNVTCSIQYYSENSEDYSVRLSKDSEDVCMLNAFYDTYTTNFELDLDDCSESALITRIGEKEVIKSLPLHFSALNPPQLIINCCIEDDLPNRKTAVYVPLQSIKKNSSKAVGEFTSIPYIAKMLQQCGVSILYLGIDKQPKLELCMDYVYLDLSLFGIDESSLIPLKNKSLTDIRKQKLILLHEFFQPNSMEYANEPDFVFFCKSHLRWLKMTLTENGLFYHWLCYHCFKQFNEAKLKANEEGVLLMSDIYIENYKYNRLPRFFLHYDIVRMNGIAGNIEVLNEQILRSTFGDDMKYIINTFFDTVDDTLTVKPFYSSIENLNMFMKFINANQRTIFLTKLKHVFSIANKQQHLSKDSELYQWLLTMRKNSGVLLILDPLLSKQLSYHTASQLGYMPSSNICTIDASATYTPDMAIIPPTCVTDEYTEFSSNDPKRIATALKKRLIMPPKLIAINMYDFLVGICDLAISLQKNYRFFTFMFEAEDLTFVDTSSATKLLRFCQRLEGWIE